MIGTLRRLLLNRLISVLAVAILLASTLGVYLVQPPSAAGETATVGWIRQFGTTDSDSARGVSAVAGAIYVGEGNQPGFYRSSLLRRYDAGGNEVWTTEIHEGGLERVNIEATYACSTGIYVFVVGLAIISGDAVASLNKCQPDGTQVWSVSPVEAEMFGIDAIFADSSGIYTVGWGAGLVGGYDTFVAKSNADGSRVWARDSGYEPSSVSCYSGSVYVGGVVEGSSGAGFVGKYDSAGNELWTKWAGFAPPVEINAVSADSSGVYVAGVAHDASEANGRQAFVRKYDSDGNELWTREFGSSSDDAANAISVNAGGVYVAGYTQGALPGQTSKGGKDAFVREYDADGNEAWTYQFGSSADDTVTSISADATGIYAAGDTDGAMPGQVSSGGQDAFVVQIAANNPPAQPSNVSPVDASLTPTLQSSAFSDPDGDTHAASQWQITTTAGNYAGPVFDSGITSSRLTTVSIPPGTLTHSTTYYWHVRYQDSHGAWSSWSAETSFTTASSPVPGDTTPPAVVADLAATAATVDSVTMTWTSPGGDGNTGTASAYDIRYSTETITDGSWGTAGQCSGEPVPGAPGSSQSFTCTGLSLNTTYYFAVKTADEVPNWSGLSNVVSKKTETTDTLPPTVMTSDADGITTDSARLNGDLTSLGTAGGVTVSFFWGTTLGGPYPNETTGAGLTGSGTFHSDLGGLASGTTYYCQAKAVGDGTSYGAEKSFTTAGKAPQIGSLVANNGRQGEDLTVKVTGSNLNNATKVDFGDGITVSGFRVVSDDEVIAEIVIQSEAATGERDITVTTPWGTAIISGGFVVNDDGTPVHLWVYLIAAIGGVVGLGMLASLGVWLRRRSAMARRA